MKQKLRQELASLYAGDRAHDRSLFAPSCRLEEAGYGVGHRVLELLSLRDKQYKRETKLIGILQVRR